MSLISLPNTIFTQSRYAIMQIILVDLQNAFCMPREPHVAHNLISAIF